jgi:hypothetical protein
MHSAWVIVGWPRKELRMPSSGRHLVGPHAVFALLLLDPVPFFKRNNIFILDFVFI